MMIKDLHTVGNRNYLLIYDSHNIDQKAYGPHLMLDVWDCNAEKLADKDFCERFLSSLPEKIGMTKIAGPFVFDYECVSDDMESGVTGMAVIAESHLSIHTYPKKNYAFIDIFSCRHFDHEFVTELIVQMFEVKETNAFLCKRGVGFN